MINDVRFVMKRHEVYSCPHNSRPMMLFVMMEKILFVKVVEFIIVLIFDRCIYVWLVIQTPHIELSGWLRQVN
jgi:hypothetical protein